MESFVTVCFLDLVRYSENKKIFEKTGGKGAWKPMECKFSVWSLV